MVKKNLKISKLIIGDGKPPIFFPDIGTFFNKNIKVAKDLINNLIKSGAEVIKGEVLHDPNIAMKNKFEESYLMNNGRIKYENTRKLIERKIVSLDKYEKIFSHCKKKKIPFVLSVYDFKGADFAYEIGASALKIASSNLVHLPLIKYVKKFNLPVILDTGRSSYEEIRFTINWIRKLRINNIHLQHSPYPPPHPISKHDLNMIQTMKKDFKFTVGLSDHFNGTEMLYAAIALGASSVEKGIINNDIRDDQDVYHALNVNEFKKVNEMCKNIYFAMGKKKRFLKKKDARHPYRMGLIAKQNLKKGEQMRLEMISYAFPKLGIPVEKTFKVIGKTLKKHKIKNSPIFWSDICENIDK